MGLSGHASGEAVVGATIGMVALAALFVLTRLFTRLRVVRDPGLDDGFIVAALLFSIATTTTMCLQGKYHRHDIPSHTHEDYSEVRHGPTHVHSHSTRCDRVTEAILRLSLGLQPLNVLHEDINSATVSQDIPAEMVPPQLLWTYGYRGALHGLGFLQCRVRLLADSNILESECISEWTLSSSLCCLVQQH